MGRKKIDTTQFLTDTKIRRKTFKKRKQSALKKIEELCALTGSHALVYILDEECGFGNGLLERSVFSTNPHRFLRIIDEHKIPRQEGFVQNNTQVSYSASLRDAPIRSPIGSLTENGQVYVPAMTSTTTTTIQQKKDKT